MRRAVLAEDDELPPASPPVPPWPGHAVEIGGRSIFVRETPAPGAEPALYVHGLGGSSQNWTDLAGLLQPRVDGLALDLPGFGYSDPAPRYSQRAFADCVITLIEQTDRGPVHLIGNSLGGAVSVRVAAVRPDLVRTLTLVSPAMPFLDPRRSLQGRVVPFLALPRVDRLAARQMAAIPPEQLATEVLRACFANPDAIPPQRLAEAVAEARRRSEVQHFASAYTGAMRGLVLSFLRAQLPGPGSLWAMARRITVPTLVIAGLRDRLVDVRAVSRVARAIPDTRLLLLPDVGHVAQMEVPRVVARAILGLFASASSQASASSASSATSVASSAASSGASPAQDAG